MDPDKNQPWMRIARLLSKEFTHGAETMARAQIKTDEGVAKR